MERPDLHFLWAGLIPHPGMVVLEGEPKVGKSFLALQIAKAIGAGEDFGGRPCKQARVLYLILEEEITWYNRMKDLVTAGFPFPPHLFVPNPFHPERPIVTNILHPDTIRWLHGIQKETDPELVVIDPLRELHSSDEQDSTAMKIVGDAMMGIFRGRSLLVVHHSKKMTTDPDHPHPPNPIQAGRGSSYIPGKASSVWLLWKEKEDDPQAILRIVPRFAERTSLSLEQQSSGLWVFTTGQPIPVDQLPPSIG